MHTVVGERAVRGRHLERRDSVPQRAEGDGRIGLERRGDARPLGHPGNGARPDVHNESRVHRVD